MNIPAIAPHVHRPGVYRMLAAATVLFLGAGTRGLSQAPPAADSVAVLTASRTLLRAISTRDTSLARPLLLPGGVFVSVRPAGTAGMARVQTHENFLETLPAGNVRYLERMWSPKITFAGLLAEVRGPYDFHIDGKFSHCGVDVFTLVKTADGWKISGTAYTSETAGCVASPLGPPTP